ncbi:MAG: ATP synthase F1 subunit epsilon [Pseudomonadota bacterium]
MVDKVRFELVSPERLLLDETVEMVVVPGSEGEFGVLRGHAPLISSLRPGVLEVHDDGVVRERIFIAGGFVEVTGTRVTVLADEAIRLPDLDRAAIESELAELRADLGEAKDDGERARVGVRMAVAEAKLAALG